jgi:hypothetical protein
LWFVFVSIEMKFFFFWSNQFFSIRLCFAFDAFVLSLLKYYWWKFFINSSTWTSSAYIHWFSMFDQFNHLTKYCNRFRYNLLFNINFISSCFFYLSWLKMTLLHRRIVLYMILTKKHKTHCVFETYWVIAVYKLVFQ